MTDLPICRIGNGPRACARQAASVGVVSRGTIAAVLTAIAFGCLQSSPSKADSIAQVEGARAKERAGYHLNRQDVEKLNRYGGNDDGYRPYDNYEYDYGPPGGYGGGGYVYRDYDDGDWPRRRVYPGY